ncbi:hypothetical protein V1264_012679 [Littorina saxatilis]|uniref:Uncharacterized protein n=1 Tax=Littorina saxatilis TaxID=31220 RepID=A0AAN9BVH0_9CAEN
MTSTLTDFQTTGGRRFHSEGLFETNVQRHRRQRTEWERKDRAKKRCMRDIFAKSNEELLNTNETYKIEINRLCKFKNRLKEILQQHDCRLRVLPPITPTPFSPCSTYDITKMTSEGNITDSQGDWCNSSHHIESFEWKSKTKAEEKITENETPNVAGDVEDDVMKGDDAAGTYFLSDRDVKARAEQREKTFVQGKLNRKGGLPFKARTEQREEAPFQLRSSSSFSGYSSANTLATSSAFDASSKATATTSENFVEKQNSYGWSSCQNVPEASTVGSVNSFTNRIFDGSNVYQALPDTSTATSVIKSANQTSDGSSSFQTLSEATVVASVNGIDQTHISGSFNLCQAATEGTTVIPANGFGNRTSDGLNFHQVALEAATVTSINGFANQTSNCGNLYQADSEATSIFYVNGFADRTFDGSISQQAVSEATAVNSANGFANARFDGLNLRQAVACETGWASRGHTCSNLQQTSRADPAHFRVAFGELPADVSFMMSLYDVCIDDDFLMDC